MLAELASRYMPFALLVPLHRRTPRRRSRPACRCIGHGDEDDRATAYVCRDFACRQPVTTASRSFPSENSLRPRATGYTRIRELCSGGWWPMVFDVEIVIGERELRGDRAYRART